MRWVFGIISRQTSPECCSHSKTAQQQFNTCYVRSKTAVAIVSGHLHSRSVVIPHLLSSSLEEVRIVYSVGRRRRSENMDCMISHAINRRITIWLVTFIAAPNISNFFMNTKRRKWIIRGEHGRGYKSEASHPGSRGVFLSLIFFLRDTRNVVSLA